MQEPIFPDSFAYKLYNERSVLICTFLGGPLAAAYLMASNYRSFGEEGKAVKTWMVSILTLLLVGATSFVPALDRIPTLVFSFVLCMAAHALTRKLQGRRLATHAATGGAFYGTGRVVLISLAVLAVMVAAFLGLLYLAD